MPAPKMYTKAQWDEFARLLDALPEKSPSERRITVRDAMPNVRAHIDSARAKGYSVEQLIEQAKQAGIDVTTSALRYAMQETKKRKGTGRRPDGASGARGYTNTSHNQSAKRTTGQQTSLAPQEKTVREDSKPGSMVIQDAFSFKINPDIEDL
ncbi:hypothetical protein AWB64_00982 [Caballeronia sordidicola]|uniref:Uncharacterized protein n=1 Tax=Caballeronia sordidicola TaxID=196367 RepID=A0A158F967_CABSO|nr:hypothetical protein [Caballeronia sordidicola]SAL16462.1 hypothetical protein AWB64_00982 [Caballeronia sordidicola]